MADDEVEKLADSLSGLNTVTKLADKGFQGFTKRLIKYSDATSKAGRRWTIFARLVSGSPLWRLQNKVRAFVDILAQIEDASKKNTLAASQEQKQLIDLVSSHGKLTKELVEVNKVKKLIQEGSQQAAVDMLKENKAMQEAIKGTAAYANAKLTMKSVDEQVLAGIEELLDKGVQQSKVFEAAQKQAIFDENLESKAGRGRIKSGIRSQERALKEEFFLTKKKPQAKTQHELFKGLEDKIKATLKLGERREKFQEKMAKRTLKYRKGMIGLQKTMKPVLNYAFKVMIMLMLGIMGFLVLAKFIHDSLGILEEMGVIDDIMEIGSLVLENVMLIFGMIGALLSGDIYTFLDYALEFVDNLLLIGLGIIKVVLKGLLALAIGVFYTVIDTVVRFVTGIFGGENAEFTSAVFKILKKALFIFLAAYVIKQIAIQMLTVVAIYAMPLLIGAVIIAGIAALFRKVFKFIPFFADGGVSDGGLSVVGEKGPELVSLPKGARVHSNAESKKMASSNVVNNNVNVTINAKDTSDAELRRIADQVGNMITNKLNRTTSSSGFVR